MESDLTSPQVADGTVQMWCEDENSLTWLTQNTPRIRLPDTDLTLTIMRQSDVPTRVRAALFVPRYKGDVARLQSILTRQNPWYDIGRWSLYKATSVGGDNHGTCLTLGIPADEVDKVLDRERCISYLFRTIYVCFYPRAHPTDEITDTTETPNPTPTDTDMANLEEEMLEAAMADVKIDAAPTSPGWTTQLLAFSSCDNLRETEDGGELSDGSVSI
ncbi:hypothetical protein PYW08_010500 [Mythimna loreyi]|uniref:Uncharacterized protein n=1 Tax=Mythimna loreyi TaxID=667449 RepID=A0ACC2Q7F1_9NEOP|nr:hypothetical protein PYW08_010500 [Mythimna loreyi]